MKITPVTSAELCFEIAAWTPAVGSPLVQHDSVSRVLIEEDVSNNSAVQLAKFGWGSDAAKRIRRFEGLNEL